MILRKKRGAGDARSSLNLGGRSNTYARKEYKAGSYVQESLLESWGYCKSLRLGANCKHCASNLLQQVG